MTFQTPSRFMAGIITVVLLAFFGVVLLVPGLSKGSFDAGLVQTLQNLVILAVGYYIGSSKSSDEKNDVIAKQVDTASVIANAVLPATPPTPPMTTDGTPIVHVDDSTPISVQEAVK